MGDVTNELVERVGQVLAERYESNTKKVALGQMDAYRADAKAILEVLSREGRLCEPGEVEQLKARVVELEGHGAAYLRGANENGQRAVCAEREARALREQVEQLKAGHQRCAEELGLALATAREDNEI